MPGIALSVKHASSILTYTHNNVDPDVMIPSLKMNKENLRIKKFRIIVKDHKILNTLLLYLKLDI